MTPCPDASTLRLGPIFQVPLDKLSYLELQVLYTERIIPRSGLAGKFCGQFRDIFQVLTQGLPLRLIFPVGMREIIHGHSSLDRTELARAPRAHAMTFDYGSEHRSGRNLHPPVSIHSPSH